MRKHTQSLRYEHVSHNVYGNPGKIVRRKRTFVQKITSCNELQTHPFFFFQWQEFFIQMKKMGPLQKTNLS